MTTNSYKQASAEKRLYQQQISGDSITSAVWTLLPSDGNVVGAPVNTVTSSTVLISGLTAGTTYQGKVHLVCASGQVIEGTFSISCH